MLLIHRQIFTLPVTRLTEWFQHFQRGEVDTFHPIKEKGELGKLASEVEQVALSLRVARKIVSDKATERIDKEELWTENKLRDLIHARLGERRCLWYQIESHICMSLMKLRVNLNAFVRQAV